jgi:formate/nitrite transporter FocA (FNT family)
VGTIEVMYVILLGQAQVWPSLVGVVLPALVGNVLGGTFIFALMSHAQVKADVE